MFEHTKAYSSFSVDSTEKAKQFYSETLDLTVTDGEMGILNLKIPGSTDIWIYPKPNHIPATFTILNLIVKNIDQAVNELTTKGVIFEKYDGMNQDEKGIARGEGPTIAWFTDPAGNILSLIEDSTIA